jgi:hypothetical protein
MLSVVILNVVILSAVGPKRALCYKTFDGIIKSSQCVYILL